MNGNDTAWSEKKGTRDGKRKYTLYFKRRTSLLCGYFNSMLTSELHKMLLCSAVQIDKKTILTDLCTLTIAVIKTEYAF